jgi:mRNA interferase MazF
MAKFVKGDVVVIPFPFSDLSGNKKRPALVIANLPGTDIILCQITSRIKKDKYVVPLAAINFSYGSLPVESFIRTNKIFTADSSIILRKAGSLRKETMQEVTRTLIEIFVA